MTALQPGFLLMLALLLLINAGLPAADTASCGAASNTTLEFLYMTSFGESLNSSGSVIGMLLALEKINSNSSILANYTLDYSNIANSECNRSVSLAEFFQAINDPCRSFISILGSGCSVATEPVAEISHFWGLTQMSYSSSAGHFNDKTRFRKYLQMFPTEDNLAPAIVALIKYFGWKQVGIITQREALFIRSHNQIRQLLDNINVTILPGTSFLETFVDPSTIRNLFPENGRIFFLNVYEDKARQVLCQAYHEGLYGDNYLWMVFGWYDNNWWEEAGQFNCTSEQLYTVVKGSLAVQHYPVIDDTSRKVIGNISYDEYIDEYSRRVANSSYIESFNSHLAYDVVWALAFALDKVIKGETDEVTGICSNALVKDTISQWSYTRNTTASCLVYETLLNTDFEGLSGQIVFDENGIRYNTTVRLLQYRNGNLVPFGTHFNNELRFMNGENVESIFPNGIPPDGQPITITTTIHEALIATIYVFAALGIILSIVCFIFITIANRIMKNVELASNALNYCLLLGVLMISISLLFYNRQTNPTIITVLCYIQLWFSIIGYTIVYSTILVQMWKIYYVHLNPKDKKALQTWHLLCIIAIPVLAMVVILFLGSVIPTVRPSAFLADDLENPSTTDSRDIVKNFVFYNCFSSNAKPLFAVVFIFLGVMQIFQVVLTVQTRKVKIGNVKGSAIVIYVTTCVLVLLVIIKFACDGYQNTTAGLLTAGYIGTIFSVIIVIFIHKFTMLYKKDGDRIGTCQGQLSTFSETANPTETTQHLSMVPNYDDQLKINSLNLEIEKLKSTLEKRKSCTNDIIQE